MCLRCNTHGFGLGRRSLLAALSATLVAGAAPSEQETVTGDVALRRLMEGNARYVANKPNYRDYAAGRAARVVTHRPHAMLLSCADARVGPEFIFDQHPGDMFVVRVAGNVLMDEGLASLEYAAAVLGSPLVMVLGHSGCGAVDAAIKVVKDGAQLPGHLPGLIDRIKPAVQAVRSIEPASLLNAAIAENVRRNVQAITAAGPVLADMVASGKVKVAGGVYDIGTGQVTLV